MVFDSKRVETSLKKKGFVNGINRANHHKYFEFYYEDKLVAWTKISHNNQDIGSTLIKLMSYQCKLDKKDFVDLIKCPLSKKAYIKILEKKGFLE